MNRFKNSLLVILNIICIAYFCITMTACSGIQDTRDNDIVTVYNMYVANAEENGTTPLSYNDWLLTIKGEQGPAGTDGADGKSAYEIWLECGNTGTEDDFLNWLKGTNGKDGLGIKDVKINDDGDLIITFDNGTTLNAGNVVDKSNRLNSNNKIVFKTLEATGNTVYGKVSNATETFSFIDEINLVGNAGYTVYTDLQGTKAIPTKTVTLEVGDNTFYILESCANDSNLYTVTIRRRPIYTVTFIDLENSSLPIIQQVEEDSFATRPDIDPLCGWDPDSAFTTPITKNITIEITPKIVFETSELPNGRIVLTEFGRTLSTINVSEDIIINTNHRITKEAFYDCRNLKNVILCNELEAIQERAFMNCTNLQSITLPSRLEHIESSAFENCDSLSTVTIPSNVKKIDEWAFYSCDSLTSVTMENGVEQLGEEAFNSCGKLKSVTIPASITQMGDLIFKNCNALNTITYLGTKAQWNSLVEGLTLYNGSNVVTVTCTDGTVQL